MELSSFIKQALTLKLSTTITYAVFFSVILFGSLTSAATHAQSKPLRIAVAANFAPILEKLLPEFTAETHIQVQVISGASGTLFLQIMHGAPFDVFLSADSERPVQLEAQKYIVANSRHTYALGELALWSNARLVTVETLTALPISQRIAIANPDIAPYGKAAKETLTALGLWQQFEHRLITGINVNQTFQQVRSKAVEIGLVANSQLVLNNFKGFVIPTDYHFEIKQQMVILHSSKQQENAATFSQFLLRDNIQQQIEQLGYAKNLRQRVDE